MQARVVESEEEQIRALQGQDPRHLSQILTPSEGLRSAI
jgi:hypothetical protein